MVGPQQISFGGDLLAFHLPRTLRFSLLSFNECSLFLELQMKTKYISSKRSLLGSNHLLQQIKQKKTESKSKDAPRKCIVHEAIKI
jgi:hypothetical protein